MPREPLLIILLLIAVGILVFVKLPSNTPVGQAMTIEEYVRQNISTLSPEHEVLGGTFSVTSIEAHGGAGTVRYEDGHNAFAADFTYAEDERGVPTVTSFRIGKQAEDGWKTSTNSEGITFRYPLDFSTVYIHTVDPWPPQIRVESDPFTCTEAGTRTSRAGGTERRTINGRAYCVTSITEGAAGSTYTQYAFATATGNNKVIMLTFTLRFVQCANYEEPQKSACEKERSTFDIGSIIDRIVKTI